MNRAGWRLVGQMHIAETRDKAIEQVRFGLAQWLDYFREVANLPLVPDHAGGDPVEASMATGSAVIGTPDDAVARSQKKVSSSGGGWVRGGLTRRTLGRVLARLTPR